MKKPYIRKYGKILNFTVWIVDGNYIRSNINKDLTKEFTNFGQHYRFRFIPKNEFWIDREYGKEGEESFYIDHLLVENKLMAEGKSYAEALDKADIIERRERSKSMLIKENIKKKLNKEEIIKKIHKKLLKNYSKNVKIWIVNGEIVRDIFSVDFTEGGHDKVYSFIPEKEIWIDDDVKLKERKFILLHELHERNLMAKGWSYYIKSKKSKSAHWSAMKLEHLCRHHPKLLEKKIKEEVKKAEKD